MEKTFEQELSELFIKHEILKVQMKFTVKELVGPGRLYDQEKTIDWNFDPTAARLQANGIHPRKPKIWPPRLKPNR